MPSQGASSTSGPELLEARVTTVGSERWGPRPAPQFLSRGPGGPAFVAEHIALSGELYVFPFVPLKDEERGGVWSRASTGL